LAVAQGFPFPAAASTFACVPASPIWRPSARLIVLDPDDRTLLFSCTGDDGATRWFAPGGGLRRGEALTAAAVRELAEETGFRVTESGLGPVVATRGGLWRSREEDRLFFGAASFSACGCRTQRSAPTVTRRWRHPSSPATAGGRWTS
jgi:8-oxo-dGTP pyrophosphatase MutT (NUDIX family)